MSESFRYLKISNGYQRSNIFSGFKESGYWEVNPITPIVAEMKQGETRTIPISISRTDFQTNIELKLLNLPLGMSHSFNPPVLSGDQTTSTLTLSATETSPYDTTTGVVVAGLPAPRRVGQFQIKLSQGGYWEFGAFTEGTTVSQAHTFRFEIGYENNVSNKLWNDASTYSNQGFTSRITFNTPVRLKHITNVDVTSDVPVGTVSSVFNISAPVGLTSTMVYFETEILVTANVYLRDTKTGVELSQSSVNITTSDFQNYNNNGYYPFKSFKMFQQAATTTTSTTTTAPPTTSNTTLPPKTLDFTYSHDGNRGYSFTPIAGPMNPVSWGWGFGDGVTSYLQSPTYTYQEDGVYNVTLNATWYDGETRQITKTISVASTTTTSTTTTTTTTTTQAPSTITVSGVRAWYAEPSVVSTRTNERDENGNYIYHTEYVNKPYTLVSSTEGRLGKNNFHLQAPAYTVIKYSASNVKSTDRFIIEGDIYKDGQFHSKFSTFRTWWGTTSEPRVMLEALRYEFSNKSVDYNLQTSPPAGPWWDIRSNPDYTVGGNGNATWYGAASGIYIPGSLLAGNSTITISSAVDMDAPPEEFSDGGTSYYDPSVLYRPVYSLRNISFVKVN